MFKCKIIIILYIIIQGFVLFGQTIPYEKIKQIKDDSLRCERLIEAAEYYKYHSVDTLILLGKELEEVAKKLRSDEFLGYGYNILSLGYKFQGNFENAATYAHQALEVNKKTKNLSQRAKILLNYADLLCQQKYFDQCEIYHREGIQLSLIQNDSSLLSRYYINTGLMFAKKQSFDSAAHYYKKGISISDKSIKLKNIGITGRLNLSQLYSTKGEHKQSIRYAKEVYEYGIAENDQDHVSLGANNVALGYLKLKDYDKALEYITNAEKAAIKFKSPQNRLYALGTKSDIYAGKGDYKAAYETALAYVVLKDSIRTALYDKNLTEITNKYEVKEKEHALHKQKLIIQEQASFQKTIILIGSVGVLGFLMVFQLFKNKQEVKRKHSEMEARRAHLEAEKEHAEVERLHEIENMRSNFFENISHEFRTPLTLILGPAEQLLKDENQKEHPKFKQMIYRNASRLQDLVNQLLDLAKLESGKAKISVKLGNLSDLCKSVFYMFESLASKKSLSMEILLPEEEVYGFFDKEVVEKILVNLLSNAIKFTPDEGLVTLKLIKNDHDSVNISVGDTGIGIAPDKLDQLFNKFVAFASSEVQQGSGIGLSLVNELVNLHKGKLYVESEENIGTIFRIELDLSESIYSDDEKGGELKQEMFISGLDSGEETTISARNESFVSSMKEKKHKPVLLLAEDNEDVRKFVVSLCHPFYEVLESSNGIQGLAISKEKIPDLIITDIMMPEMDGFTFCEALKSNEITSHIPVIMLTAKNELAEKMKGLKTGADEYLTKPFSSEELLTRLENMMAHKKRVQEYFKKTYHAFTPNKEEMTDMESAFLIKVREIVEKNLHNERFGVSELSEMLGLSRSQLHRKLTGLMDVSPNELVRNIRLEKAKILLKQKAATISEIAYSCGFNSPAYFAKCYKDYFGHQAGQEIS